MSRKGGSSYPWYRMYTEARTDTKLRALTKPQHYVWFNLLCLSADQDDRGVIADYDSELLAVEVADGDETLLAETIERLVKFRILEVVDGGWRFIPGLLADFSHDTSSDLSPERVEWNALRAELTPVVLARDGALCRYCGSTDDLTIDHVTPLAHGGSNNLTNLVVACRICNSSKGARLLEEWL